MWCLEEIVRRNQVLAGVVEKPEPPPNLEEKSVEVAKCAKCSKKGGDQ